MPKTPENNPATPVGFEFTRNEQLYNAVGDGRFRAWLTDAQTRIHEAKLSGNSYGEFLFVTLTRGEDTYTYYGLGYHDHRETWIEDRWHFYRANRKPDTSVRVETAEAKLSERIRDIAVEKSYSNEQEPSQRALLYAMLADLTDEDGALADLDDLMALGWRFEDEDE